MVTDKTTLQELFDEAKEKTDKIVLENEIYILKDLFRGIEWNRIPKGNRTKLGGQYLRYIEEHRKDIENAGKTPQNQQKYKKRRIKK